MDCTEFEPSSQCRASWVEVVAILFVVEIGTKTQKHGQSNHPANPIVFLSLNFTAGHSVG